MNENNTKKIKKGTSWLAWIFGCFGIFILIASVSLNFFLGFMLVLNNAFSAMQTEASKSPFNETVISGSGANKVAVIHLSGTIMHESPATGLFAVSEPGVETLVAQLEAARLDDTVKAIVFDVDSPGGSVSASDILYQEVLKVQASGKPVVSYYGETSASGAYYSTVSSDYIIAERSGIVGSIGVILGGYDVTGLMDKIGVKELVFKSGEHKDILSPTREQTDEDRAIVQGLIDELKNQFVGIVLSHRTIPESQRLKAFDGRIFSATQAKEIGLIDDVGYFDDAIVAASELANLSEYTVIEYQEDVGFAALFGAISNIGASNEIAGIVSEIKNQKAQMLYLWK